MTPELTADDRLILGYLREVGAIPGGAYRVPLWKFEEDARAPYVDGNVLRPLVRRGLVERLEPANPVRPSERRRWIGYRLTNAGLLAVNS